MKKVFGKALCFLLVIVLYMPSLFSQVTGINKLPDLIPYRKGNKWGFCDRNKKIVIPLSFDNAYLFGCVPDPQAVKYVPDSLAWVKKGDKEYYINKNGKVTTLPPESNVEIEGRDEAIYKEDAPFYKRIFKDAVTGKKGLISEDGKVDTLLPAIFEDIACSRFYRGNYVRVKENGKWGIMLAPSRKWLLSPAYEKIEEDNVENDKGKEIEIYKIMDKGLWGVFIGETVVLPAKYLKISLTGFGEPDYFFRIQSNAGFEIADLTGKTLTNVSYEELDVPYSGMCKAKRNGKWGLVATNGKEVIACKYEMIWWHKEQQLCWVKVKGKDGYVGVTGIEYFED